MKKFCILTTVVCSMLMALVFFGKKFEFRTSKYINV